MIEMNDGINVSVDLDNNIENVDNNYMNYAYIKTSNKENQNTNNQYYTRKKRSHAELEFPLSLEQELSDLSIRCNFKKKLKLENNMVIIKEDTSNNKENTESTENNGEIIIKDENDDEIMKINLETEKQLVDTYYSKRNRELLEAMFGNV